MRRRDCREQVFKLVFQYDFNPEEDAKFTEDIFFKFNSVKLDDEELSYVSDRYEKIIENLGDIDKKLDNSMEGWTISRIGKVELALLRVAVYEIIYDDDIDKSVAINEAVELAHKFGPERSASFINGILSKIGD